MLLLDSSMLNSYLNCADLMQVEELFLSSFAAQMRRENREMNKRNFHLYEFYKATRLLNSQHQTFLYDFLDPICGNAIMEKRVVNFFFFSYANVT